MPGAAISTSNRTFIRYADGIQPGPPPAHSTDPSSACFAEAMEVKVTVDSLSPEQLEIAHFWADDPARTATPAGHSLSIFLQLARQQDISLAAAAEGFALLGMAVSDAFVRAGGRSSFTTSCVRSRISGR